MNLAHYVIGRQADLDPDKLALIDIDDHQKPPSQAQRWTYRELDLITRAIARQLEGAGMVAGEKVLICLQNASDYFFFFMGAIAGGYVPVPLSPQLKEQELRFLVADSQAKWAVINLINNLVIDKKCSKIFP